MKFPGRNTRVFLGALEAKDYVGKELYARRFDSEMK